MLVTGGVGRTYFVTASKGWNLVTKNLVRISSVPIWFTSASAHFIIALRSRFLIPSDLRFSEIPEEELPSTPLPPSTNPNKIALHQWITNNLQSRMLSISCFACRDAGGSIHHAKVFPDISQNLFRHAGVSVKRNATSTDSRASQMYTKGEMMSERLSWWRQWWWCWW